MPELTRTVAVVIPCYNAEKTIARTIRSVLLQAHAPDEIIVVDDGSSDESIAIAHNAGKLVRVLSGPNAGACAARNRGMRAARSDYVMFLDADDEIAGDPLGSGAALAARTDSDLILTAMLMRTEERFFDFRDNLPEIPDSRDLFENWLQGQQVNPSAMLWRRNFLETIGGWNEDTLIQQDGELALRAFLNDAKVRRNGQGYGIYYRQRPGSISTDKSEIKERNYIATLAGLLAKARGTRFAPHTVGIERALYQAARSAFLCGWHDIGREALRVLGENGQRQHFGTMRHRFLATLIGLELKSRLWGA